MPNALSTSSIVLPKSVVPVIGTKMKDSSTIAALSPAEPAIFADKSYLVFNGSSEAEVVAEGAAKGYYTDSPSAVVAKATTIQTTTRVSAQLKWADEDNRLEIIDAIQADQAKALGRALDYIVYHAVSPKSGAAISNYTGLTAESTVNKVALGAVLASATDAQFIASFDKLVDAVNDTYEVNGIAMAKSYANAMRKIRVESTMMRLYPDIPLNLQVGKFEGVDAAVSSTVNGALVANATNPVTYGTSILAILGDFGLIRWGLVRDITAEVIEYGDPDNQGDLKRYNQIAYRTEAVLAHAIIDPAAFAILYGVASL